MKSKLKKTFVSFLIMTSFGIAFSSPQLWHMGWDSIHVGLLYVLGLLFGPYGALGAVLGNVIIDLADSYTPLEILPSAIISFGVSYLAYKLWYSGLKLDRITKPRLNNIYQLVLFLSTIFICGRRIKHVK
jgi:sigma-B regulation protein RsbU (phosphoserine phosphatase)